VTSDATTTAFRKHDPRRASHRFLIGSAASAAIAWLLPASFGWAIRAVVAWDVFAVVVLGLMAHLVLTLDPEETQHRAGGEDPGRTLVWVVVLGASTFSLFAAVGVMRHAKDLAPEAIGPLVAACFGAVVLAWLLTHGSYALRYAHLYYRDDREGVGGLSFPGGEAPCLSDFVYFAVVLGMCFQTSDVCITSRQIRFTVLTHSVLSFAYNTAILALTMNLVFAQIG